MSLPLEFIIDGPPVSQQTRRQSLLRLWRGEVQSAVKQHWAEGELLASGLLMITIMYFYNDRSLDIDNVPKPILDALKGIVFEDDNQVTDLICRKRKLVPTLNAPKPSSVLDEELHRRKEFVYVLVERAPGQEIVV